MASEKEVNEPAEVNVMELAAEASEDHPIHTGKQATGVRATDRPSMRQSETEPTMESGAGDRMG